MRSRECFQACSDSQAVRFSEGKKVRGEETDTAVMQKNAGRNLKHGLSGLCGTGKIEEKVTAEQGMKFSQSLICNTSPVVWQAPPDV